MDNIAGRKSTLTWVVHLSVVALVLLWLFPTIGLFVSSFRTTDQITASGWWKSMFPSEQNLTLRVADPGTAQVQKDGLWVIEGNLFDGAPVGEISVWGTSSREIAAYSAGETADLGDGESLTVQSNGDYVMTATAEMTGRGQRVSLLTERGQTAVQRCQSQFSLGALRVRRL